MRIKDCKIDDQYTIVSPEQKISEIAGSVRNNNFAVVIQEKRPVGVLTADDLVNRVFVAQKNPQLTLVKDVMTSPVVVVGLSDDLKKVSELMAKKSFLSLPVIDENEHFVGVITIYDVISKLRGSKRK